MFMSEHLWHSVQPLYNSSDRYALTMWFNHITKKRIPEQIPAATELIFVAIPCYRDIEIIKTLKSMISQAKDPQNLRIAVFLQINMSEDFDLMH